MNFYRIRSKVVFPTHGAERGKAVGQLLTCEASFHSKKK